jgi:hypothetical protein
VESASGGSVKSSDQFFIHRFGRNLPSVAVKIFSYLKSFIKIFYKFCFFNTTYVDNDAINYIIFPHKYVYSRQI